MRFVLPTIALCAGCAKIDPEPDFPPASFTITQEQDLGITVTGALYTMHFAGGDPGIHFPDQLRVNDSASTNVLGRALGCGGEQLVGLAMFPAFVTAPAISQPPNDDLLTLPPNTNDLDFNSLSINSSGPHVVQISTTFTVDYNCTTGERFSGRSAFTFFPSGRIVRHDSDLRPSTNMLAAGGQTCGCGTADTLLAFTSFWTFERGTPDGRMVQRGGAPLTFTAENADQPGPYDGLCMMYDDHAIGLSYAGMGISRARRNNPGGNLTGNFASVFDFNFDDTLSPFVMGPNGEDEPYDITSAIQIVTDDGLANSDCQAVLSGLAEPGMEVDGVVLNEADADGIYNDFVVHDDDFVVRATVGALPPGWALRTVLASGAAKITRDPDLGRAPALVQRESSDINQFLFYFPDGLAVGETITIEPQ